MHLLDPRMIFTPLHDLGFEIENAGGQYETVQADVTAVKEAAKRLDELIRERVLTLFDAEDEEDEEIYELIDDLTQALDQVDEELTCLQDDMRELDVASKLEHHIGRLLTT
jgi:hypothetical protein